MDMNKKICDKLHRVVQVVNNSNYYSIDYIDGEVYYTYNSDPQTMDITLQFSRYESKVRLPYNINIILLGYTNYLTPLAFYLNRNLRKSNKIR